MADDDLVPNVARMYDYYLGGAHNFGPDRAAAEQVMAQLPHVRDWARANRRFLANAVRHCAAQGVDQFLDLGSGIPTVGAVHEVARAVVPGARVVYVDVEPVAVAQARELLEGVDDVSVVQADLRAVDEVLASTPLDLTRPVAVLMVAVLHFLDDADGPREIVRRYVETLASGSFLALSHVSADYDDPVLAEQMRAAEVVYQRATGSGRLRDRTEIAALADGLEIVGPGLVDVNRWRPGTPAGDDELGAYGLLARTPGGGR